MNFSMFEHKAKMYPPSLPLMQPYRQPSAIIKPPKDNRPTHGLIRAPKPAKLHACSTPSFLKHILCFLIGSPIRKGSVFRCSCGQVYVYKHPTSSLVLMWFPSNDHSCWLDAGGKIENSED